MKNKKAVSDIVSTVLIILLVVAAIAIVGAIVLNVVSKAGPKVDALVQCQTLDIKPTGCVKSTGVVAVTRGASGSDVSISKITVYGERTDGTTINSADTTAVPVAFSNSSATVSTAGLARVKVAAKLSGATDYCPQSAALECS